MRSGGEWGESAEGVRESEEGESGEGVEESGGGG